MADCWRCDACGSLMYNVMEVDGQLYPAPGSPLSKFINKKYKNVCTLCFELWELEKKLNKADETKSE